MPEENAADDLLAAIRQKFDGRMQKEEQDWCTLEMAAVYVSCRKRQAERIKMLGSALEWRIRHREMLASRICPSCSANSTSHDARLFGTDAEGDVVLMNCFALPRDLHPKGIANHMALLFERALLHYPATPHSLQRRRWSWAIDTHGFGIQHTDPRTSYELLKLLETAYPERLKRMLIVDAPALFWGLYRVVKPLIEERTAAKIVSKQRAQTSVLQQHSLPALAARLLAWRLPHALCSLRSLLPALAAPCARCSLSSMLPELDGPCACSSDESTARALSCGNRSLSPGPTRRKGMRSSGASKWRPSSSLRARRIGTRVPWRPSAGQASTRKIWLRRSAPSVRRMSRRKQSLIDEIVVDR